MKYVKQLALLLLFCVLGDVLSALLGNRLPGNVLGMSLLFVLLAAGLIQCCQVEQVADFLLQNMAFFFIPACLGVLDVFPLVREVLLPILAVIVLSTFVTAAVTAGTVHFVLRLQARGREGTQ